MCNFTGQLHSCGHYHKFCTLYAEVKKIETVCTSGTTTVSESTKALYCGLYGCDEEYSLKHKGPDYLPTSFLFIVIEMNPTPLKAKTNGRFHETKIE